MGVPAHLLTQQFTRVRPATSTGSYGNAKPDYGAGANRETAMGWLEQSNRAEPQSNGRDPLVQTWLLITNYADIRGRDRIEYGSIVFEVDGPPSPVPIPGGIHHYEANLRVVEG